jgi:hypothetical protein
MFEKEYDFNNLHDNEDFFESLSQKESAGNTDNSSQKEEVKTPSKLVE